MVSASSDGAHDDRQHPTSNRELLFGAGLPIGEWQMGDVAAYLREVGDNIRADELMTYQAHDEKDSFARRNFSDARFRRFTRTSNICGFLPARGSDRLLPVTMVPPDKNLLGMPIKVTLDSLHVAQYPGRGLHSLLFDFAFQGQNPGGDPLVFHYNAKFCANDGETVPVHDFPLFHGFSPSSDGIVFGFQTINIASGLDEGLLDFLESDEFTLGVSLVSTVTPLLGQLSQIAMSLTTWFARRSKNVKVQEFRQGLGFTASQLGGGLAEGYYVVVQIPVEYERDWAWDDWVVDQTVQCLVQRDDRIRVLDFNHLIFGIHSL